MIAQDAGKGRHLRLQVVVGQGALVAGDRAVPAQPRAGAAAQQATRDVGFEGVGRDRAGCGRGHVRIPRVLLPATGRTGTAPG